MLSPLPFSHIGLVLGRAIKCGVFSAEEDDSVIFYDLSRLQKLALDLQRAFPSNALHAVAVKANPLISILSELKSLGFGAEVASSGELAVAEQAGFSSANIVYDSPVKTDREIAAALSKKIRLNADSLQELQRITRLLANADAANIGIRVNPETAEGKISYTVTAGSYSKFGVALSQERQAIKEAYLRYPWLDSIHLHVGSQTCTLATLSRAIRTVLDFALEVNEHLRRRQLRIVNIGGGLAAPYVRGQAVPSFSEYRDELQNCCPELFSDQFRVITEFGRHLHATCGFVASRVETVKEQQGIRTAMIHIGADMLTRECYRPDDWYHDIAVFSGSGELKANERLVPQTIAGPLCFSGDILASHRPLPLIEDGDLVVIGDVGAYTFSMWSRYNSRQRPKIIGYRDQDDFIVIQPRESLESVVKTWA